MCVHTVLKLFCGFKSSQKEKNELFVKMAKFKPWKGRFTLKNNSGESF